MLLITGSHGQLGQSLSALLPDAISADKNILDITDEYAVLNFFKDKKIDFIINCAAYTAVDDAENNLARADKINADGVRNLAKTGAKIIHISTDYVFDGTSYKPYTEEDEPNPQSVYGHSKLAGEQAIFDHSTTAVIIRTSWLYGSSGKNFYTTIKKIARENISINVVSDQIGTPTYVEDLAHTIIQLLPKIKIGTKEIYHYSNEGICSWYDFAHEIIKQDNLACDVIPIQSSEYPTKANRPHYSVLSKRKIKKDFNIKIPHWTESLKKCLNQS